MAKKVLQYNKIKNKFIILFGLNMYSLSLCSFGNGLFHLSIFKSYREAAAYLQQLSNTLILVHLHLFFK